MKTILILSVLLSALAINACGIKGPLYIEDEALIAEQK
ncbi:MAG: lipoprotein [Succinivibrio sp.]|nr:lipoprotein [Succinatimonas hippei]